MEQYYLFLLQVKEANGDWRTIMESVNRAAATRDLNYWKKAQKTREYRIVGVTPNGGHTILETERL